jgi:hypothetical protein
MKKRVEKVTEKISPAWWFPVLIRRVARGTKKFALFGSVFRGMSSDLAS